MKRLFCCKYFSFTLSALITAFTISDTSIAQEVPSYQQGLNTFMAQQKRSKQKSGFTEQDYQIMSEAGKQVAKQLANPGLKVGTRAPAFNLPNAHGKKVSLKSYLEQGPVILVFYRGAWCPFCNLQLNTYSKSLSHFKKYKANIIAITPQKPDKSLEQVKKTKLPFEVLSDLDSRVMKAYNLYFEVPAKLVKLYKNHGLDLDAFNGKGRHVLPAPGVFVIDQKGVIRAMEASTDYKKRMEPAAILKALASLL